MQYVFLFKAINFLLNVWGNYIYSVNYTSFVADVKRNMCCESQMIGLLIGEKINNDVLLSPSVDYRTPLSRSLNPSVKTRHEYHSSS